MNAHHLSRLLMAVLFITLASCGVLDTAEPAPPVGVPSESPSSAPPATPSQPKVPQREEALRNAYGPLLRQAEDAAQRGDYERALSLLERAQRIDPDSAEIYLAMARTHRARGDLRLARATATRGLLYCDDDAQCGALRREQTMSKP